MAKNSIRHSPVVGPSTRVISREKIIPKAVMQSFAKEAECSRCASQWDGNYLNNSEDNLALSKLSQPRAQAEIFMHDLWKACKGSRLLQQALCAIQEIWRSANGSRTESYG